MNTHQTLPIDIPRKTEESPEFFPVGSPATVEFYKKQNQPIFLEAENMKNEFPNVDENLEDNEFSLNLLFEK